MKPMADAGNQAELRRGSVARSCRIDEDGPPLLGAAEGVFDEIALPIGNGIARTVARSDWATTRMSVASVVEGGRFSCAGCPAPGESRTNQRSGYGGRDWQTRAGTVELRIPKPRLGSSFAGFPAPHRASPDPKISASPFRLGHGREGPRS